MYKEQASLFWNIDNVKYTAWTPDLGASDERLYRHENENGDRLLRDVHTMKVVLHYETHTYETDQIGRSAQLETNSPSQLIEILAVHSSEL